LVQVQNPQPAAVLPAVDRVLNLPAVSTLLVQYGHTALVQTIRSLLAEMRTAQRHGAVLPADALHEAALTQALSERLSASFKPTLRRVFNLTGTVLHTNLGRALMPAEAVAAV
jgi:L-seryl-tRNA(Ser) seleniumtransferase